MLPTMSSYPDMTVLQHKNSANYAFEFFHNFRLIRLIVQNRIYKNSATCPMIELAYLSATLTIEQKCFQYFSEAVVES